jgi:hypothetical protein
MAQVDKALLARLPRTFVPALNEQMRNWELLFPAEQRSIGAQLNWLARLPDADFDRLFQPIKDLERRMDLPRWDLTAERVSINETSILVRSPYYPQWRAQVERVFEQIDSGVAAQGKTAPANRLLLCVQPPGLPLPSGPLWPGLEKQGRWLPLEVPFAAMLEPLVTALASRKLRAEFEPVEGTWVLEYASRIANLPAAEPATVLSFEALGPVRREFLRRLNAVHKDLRSADATYEDLRRLDIRKWLEARLAGEIRAREFLRNLFLSGNGSMLFGNSFVQWGAAEVLRRVQPQALVCCFGIRPKLKPFSSVVLFEDQDRANPVPDQPDPEGSLVDIRPLTEYVYLSAGGEAARQRLVSLFAVPEWKRLLAIAPSEFAGPAPATAAALCAAAVNWLA